MGHIAGRPVTIYHTEGRVSRVGELMENAGRDINHLATGHALALVTQTHFPLSIDDEIHLFLVLVMPRHLAPSGVQGHIPHTKVFGLDRGYAAHKVLSQAPGGVPASGYLVEVRDNHWDPKKVR